MSTFFCDDEKYACVYPLIPATKDSTPARSRGKRLVRRAICTQATRINKTPINNHMENMVFVIGIPVNGIFQP